MFARMLKKDFARNKVIIATLSLFIMLAALLASTAIGIITELLGSIDNLFEKAEVPHFVQMHSGEINRAVIESFAADNSFLVNDHQVVELLNIIGAGITLGNNTATEAESIMDNAFVKQNVTFDYLLDLDNQIINVRDGEIAVPIYHRQQYDLQIGDTVKISVGAFSMEFTISTFLRDAQMNPSIITSKRFLVSDYDWEILRNNVGEIEYLIEFRLHDASRAGEFETLYHTAGLPQTGPAVTYSLFRLLNSITDGIVAAVIILVGILLVLIATLCLRFTMIAAIEEDYREIGVMKAIGICKNEIRELYLAKYVFMAATASVMGYLLSQFIGHLFTANITLYMGGAEKTLLSRLLPAIGAGLVFIGVTVFCRLVLKRFNNISAVEAIRTGRSPGGNKINKGLTLHKSKLFNVNLFLGVREVLGHFRVYGLLCFVFTICMFLMIVPINTLNTIESSKFITYMGAGMSDIRIDLQHGRDMEQRFGDMMTYIQNDIDNERHSAFTTAVFRVVNDDGSYENIKIEIGDFTVFPLSYSVGREPLYENEIALSVMNADEFHKKVGDTLTILVNGEEQHLIVSGIYQDTTNGGKTAKARLPQNVINAENILWYTVNIDLINDVDIQGKIEEYTAAFLPAKVTDMDNYISQTMGGIQHQLRLGVWFASGISIGIAVLITAMFFKMLTAKDEAQISIIHSLGFSSKDIHIQYATRALLVLFIGILTGIIAAATLGQGLASLIIPGISSMRFIVNPIVVYMLCPLLLIAAVTVTVWIIGITMKKINILLITAE